MRLADHRFSGWWNSGRDWALIVGVTSWLDGGMPGRHFIESAADVPRFIRVTSRQGPYASRWWIVNVGSMSRANRQRLLSALEDRGCLTCKFTRRHMSQMRRAERGQYRPPIPWYGRLWALVLTPLWIVISGAVLAARIIGRGPRMFLVHVPGEPPNDPPRGGSGVREPRDPYPGGDELSEAILPAD